MLWIHDEHPGRAVRLAYCMNLHPAEDVEGMLRGIRRITLPLRDRLAQGAPFGVGMWLAGSVAAHLSSAAGAEELCALGEFLRDEALDPFTFNAFPFGGFHRDGLKADVYRPTWMEDERKDYSLQVAQCARSLTAAVGRDPRTGHLSISTHPGLFAEWIKGKEDLVDCARNMARTAAGLARIEEDGGPRIILSLEAEPRANSGDTRELAGFLAFARAEGVRLLEEEADCDRERAALIMPRHLGVCLDACHAAVEFEDPGRALARVTAGGPMGKLQFSSALSLRNPGSSAEARAQLLAMDEPRYLHQVTGRCGAEFLRCNDLPDLAQALESDGSPWLDCDEWRCHFHVPVDLDRVGAGLSTTIRHADEITNTLLAAPEDWSTAELHVEIETYTWDVLPGAARGSGALVDGLEREYGHVIDLLETAGWKRFGPS